METINNYLDNMFKGLPNNSNVIDAKNELRQMMEDKYEQLLSEGKSDNEAVGIVISQFGNLDEISDLLGISSDIENREILKTIDKYEAQEYYETTKKASKMISVATMLMILIGALFVFLVALSEKGLIQEDSITIIGIPITFILLGVGTYIYITHGIKLEKYNYIEKENIGLSLAAKSYVEEVRSRLNFENNIAINLVLMLLSVIPVILTGAVEAYQDYLLYAVTLMIVVISISVKNLITTGMKKSATDKLLQVGDYTVSGKKANNLINKIASVFWPIIVISYFAYSFITDNWSYSWIIFPIAGGVFMIIAIVITAIKTDD